MSQPHLDHYLLAGMATIDSVEEEVRVAIIDAAQKFVARLESGAITSSELDAAARPMLALIEQGRVVLDRHEHAQALLHTFRDRCAAFVPSSPDSFSQTQ